MKFDFGRDFNEIEIEYLETLSENDLNDILKKCNDFTMLADTNQINRKLLINSLYGALGNIYFRYYDLRNASAITLFGQLAIQWIQRKVNEYLNTVCGTIGHKYVIAGDTDSIYVEFTPLLEKIGLDRFKDTNALVDFLSKFASQKMEPMIDLAFKELCEYMNNVEHLMFMDREAISCPPLGSKGLGGFWKAKKRYALNVYDMEGTRYAKPHLKIMGIETQQSSTPKAVQIALEESIRLMLQEGESALQEHYEKTEIAYKELDYKVIAKVSTANNVAKYDSNGYPGLKCPAHIRGVLAYNRATKEMSGAMPIQEGDKIMVIPLRPGNRFDDVQLAWPSGSELPIEFRADAIRVIDHAKLFEKSFKKPLSELCAASRIQFEKKASLNDLFGF